MRNKAVTMSSRPLQPPQPSSLRISFLHMTFAISFAMVGGGIVTLPLGWQLRGGFAGRPRCAGVVILHAGRYDGAALAKSLPGSRRQKSPRITGVSARHRLPFHH